MFSEGAPRILSIPQYFHSSSRSLICPKLYHQKQGRRSRSVLGLDNP